MTVTYSMDRIACLNGGTKSNRGAFPDSERASNSLGEIASTGTLEEGKVNKAFVREPEQGIERCPQCGAPGEPVQEVTLMALVPSDKLAEIAKTANFCASPSCPVVYFDVFERVILTADLPLAIYPKDLQAPICPCFGLTCEAIEQDIAENVVTRTRAAVERAKSSEAQCQTRSPRGSSCVGDLQRYYMKQKET